MNNLGPEAETGTQLDHISPCPCPWHLSLSLTESARGNVGRSGITCSPGPSKSLCDALGPSPFASQPEGCVLKSQAERCRGIPESPHREEFPAHQECLFWYLGRQGLYEGSGIWGACLFQQLALSSSKWRSGVQTGLPRPSPITISCMEL